MVKTEPLWGIYIKPENLKTFGIGDKKKIAYKLIIGEHTKSSKQIFVTNHAVKKRLAEIAKGQRIKGAFLGQITFVVHPSKRDIVVGAYMPFSRTSKLPRELVESLK